MKLGLDRLLDESSLRAPLRGKRIALPFAARHPGPHVRPVMIGRRPGFADPPLRVRVATSRTLSERSIK